MAGEFLKLTHLTIAPLEIRYSGEILPKPGRAGEKPLVLQRELDASLFFSGQGFVDGVGRHWK